MGTVASRVLTSTPERVENERGGRTYLSRRNGAVYPSVTTVLDVIASPGLIYWGPSVSARYAVGNWVALDSLPLPDREKEIREAPWRERDEAAERGTAAHAAIEASVLGRDVPEHPDPEVRARMRQFERFCEDYNPEWLAAELTVFNDTIGYAGTLDGVARINGRTTLIDVKTGKNIYEKAGLQLAAYARSEWAEVDPDGRVMPFHAPEAAAVLHLQKTQYRLIPVSMDMRWFEMFCNAHRLMGGMDEAKNTIFGQAETSGREKKTA